jgi:hypothetical protein
MTNELSELFERDLLKLRDELNNFKNEENIWRKLNGITNTAGNLALHIIGNLNFLVGNLVGSTAYVRNREYEFSATGVPRKKLVDDIDELIAVLKNTISNLADEEVQAIYPLEFYGKRSTGFYLMHLYGHLNYHLGQINYLRRILEA